MDTQQNETPIADGSGTTVTPGNKPHVLEEKPPLPGVIIFVHGVNSDGEWFDAAERGLCEGLNVRLARKDGQTARPGGKLEPCSYISELRPDGRISDKLNAQTFLDADKPNYSPVIRFRWGYKASGKELDEYAGSVWLNQYNAWGGGPFANGCAALSDMWAGGLNTRLFLWLEAQNFNPVKSRDVYGCPPRAYQVHAAYRLAHLVKMIRDKQKDCPITIVCHSQGNMVTLASAFIGEKIGALANTYILCNPPYSLVGNGFATNWTQTNLKDRNGNIAAVTSETRIETLRNFLDLVATQTATQDPAEVDRRCANKLPDGDEKFDCATEQSRNSVNHGRVFLYCCPHDQVVSALTVQGIGWLGVSTKQMEKLKNPKNFFQRVWAQGFEVGNPTNTKYDYWANHYRRIKVGSNDFWNPPSPSLRFRLEREKGESRVLFAIKFGVSSFLYALNPLLSSMGWGKVNALPPDEHVVPVNAPPLPKYALLPRTTVKPDNPEAFDEVYDKDRDSLNSANKEGPGALDHAGKGNVETEARLRYEYQARMGLQAHHRTDAPDGKYDAWAPDEQKTEKARQWEEERKAAFLMAGDENPATDHSTILTNALHAQNILAWDVAVGYSTLNAEDWRELREFADWRWVPEESKFNEYYWYGTYEKSLLHEYSAYKTSGLEKFEKIADKREWTVAQPEV